MSDVSSVPDRLNQTAQAFSPEAIDGAAGSKSGRRAPRARAQFVLLGLGIASLVAAQVFIFSAQRRIDDIAISSARRGWALDFVLAGFVLFALVGFRALWLLFRAALHREGVPGLTWVGITVSAGLSALGALLALASAIGFGRGRQLRRFGRTLLPKLARGEGWNAIHATPEVPAELRSAIAAQWRENGRTEHASVAAFAHLQLQLVSLGAPPELVRTASEDALDEIRHAELCFSLARALDGCPLEPAPFTEARHARPLPRSRTLALVQLAVDSLVEGALLEGFSARTIAQLAPRCTDATTHALLRELAADEGRHTRHGWDVVCWCLEQGGPAVADALIGALAGLPRGARSTLPEAARDGGWERFGIPGAALEASAYARTRAHVVRRVTELVAAVRDDRAQSRAAAAGAVDA